MFAVIFGRPGCPYCVRAVQIAEQLTRRSGQERRQAGQYRAADLPGRAAHRWLHRFWSLCQSKSGALSV